VVGVTGTRVLLADQQGRVTTAALPVLAAAADFALVDRHEPAGLPPLGTLEGLAPEAVEAARWWERHILEVLHGHDPQAAPGLAPRPEYEPSRHSLSQRERAKAAELTAAGHQVSASTVKHRRQRYQSQGMVGLVDHRIDKKISVFGRSDPRVVRAMRIAIGEASDSSVAVSNYTVLRYPHNVPLLSPAVGLSYSNLATAVTGLFRQRFETILGHVLRVVQINGADSVAFQSLVDSRKVTPHGLLLSVRGLTSVRLTGMLLSRVIQLVDSRCRGCSRLLARWIRRPSTPDNICHVHAAGEVIELLDLPS